MIHKWSKEKKQNYTINEGLIALNQFAGDKISQRVETEVAYKTRMYMARAPIFQDKSILRLILKDENADEFVRNINMRIIEDAFNKTIYYKNKMLTGVNDLMSKPIKDKKEGRVKFTEIKDDKGKLQLHDNVAN